LTHSDIEDYTTEERIDAAIYHSTHGDSLEDSSPLLNELLSLVDDNDRRILTLAYVDQLNGIELAAALGVREGAAYVRVARAKEHLRKKYLVAIGRKEL
jgi:DNA-directed RNA polymerase specialized sigma24 family protein